MIINIIMRLMQLEWIKMELRFSSYDFPKLLNTQYRINQVDNFYLGFMTKQGYQMIKKYYCETNATRMD